MKKNLLALLALSVTAIMLLLGPSAHVMAQQDPPRGDCCYQIFGAGSNLGWASALLHYTSQRVRLDPADEAIFDDLNRAGQHVETAHAVCSAMNPAWPDWKTKADSLQALVNAIRRQPIPIIRGQVEGSVRSTYGWAENLRVRMFERLPSVGDTCAEKYFKLGYTIAYGQQTLAIAQEMRRNGTGQWLAALNDARQWLQLAVQVLREYELIQPILGCNILPPDLIARLTAAVNANPQELDNSYQAVLRIWGDLQQNLMTACEGAAGLRPRIRPDTTNVVGRWVVHHGGIVGTPDEHHENYVGDLVIEPSGAGPQGHISFDGGKNWETLSGVGGPLAPVVGGGVLRFTRPTVPPQFWAGDVRDNRVVEGTFAFGNLTYRWWAEKSPQVPGPEPRRHF
jgi:hypothetical protein